MMDGHTRQQSRLYGQGLLRSGETVSRVAIVEVVAIIACWDDIDPWPFQHGREHKGYRSTVMETGRIIRHHRDRIGLHHDIDRQPISNPEQRFDERALLSRDPLR